MLKLKHLLKPLFEEELEEMTGTGAVAPFQSPYAFQGTSAANKRKRKASAETAGYEVVQGRDDEEARSMRYESALIREGLETEVDTLLNKIAIVRDRDYVWYQGRMMFNTRYEADDAIDWLRDHEFPNAQLKFPFIAFTIHSKKTSR